MRRIVPRLLLSLPFFAACAALAGQIDTAPAPVVLPPSAASLFPLSAVHLLDGPFTAAVEANHSYMVALEPDRLLAPFRREAGLEPRKPSYGNWESGGLDGHTAGHYLSALSNMIASGNDKDGELARRLDYMLDELGACQQANDDGYIGGIPGSRDLWRQVSAGHLEALNGKWVPWYNLHKTFAGLRDAYLVAGNEKGKTLLVSLGNWCDQTIAGLSGGQMQQMLGNEHGGMTEVLADIYAITGDKKYLNDSIKFTHHAVVDPLEQHEDKLTGLHANTQIPKIVGLERVALLTGDKNAASGAKFFWETVTHHRSVAFGGNSVSEHFNDPANFRGLLEHREGPETCNSYNMLRLTEQLFAGDPEASFADYYERTLFNHILSAINPTHPGYVYFTPIRPGHYRVYSQPSEGFWCCVGTGMENPGKYGQFIYAHSKDDLYVNLFIASELRVPERGLTLRQETGFPNESRSHLTVHVNSPATFTIYLRDPAWVTAGAFKVNVNGSPMAEQSAPSSYLAVRREWHDGDKIDIEFPMHDSMEGLPDGSNWYAILHGPILLASPDGDKNLDGLRAGDGRGDHIAHGPLTPLDKMPVLLASVADVPKHIVPDPGAGALHFRIKDITDPKAAQGTPLVPFYELQDSRYQMYWGVTTKEGLADRDARLAAEESTKLARESATLDSIAPGEQQPEVDHAFSGVGSNTGLFNGRRYREGAQFQYSLNPHDNKEVDLAVTYWGDDRGRSFDILVNGTVLTTEHLDGPRPGEFYEKHYPLPTNALVGAPRGIITVKFIAKQWVAGGIYDIRLMKRQASQGQNKQPAVR